MPIFAAHLYDALHIYAQAATRVLAASGNVRNGTAIMQHIRNETYRSVQGFDVRIDGNGDAEGNYSVLALLANGQMGPVGFFAVSATTVDQYVFRYVDATRRPIRWLHANGRPPLAEPRCGFNGEKCIDSSTTAGESLWLRWLLAMTGIVATIAGIAAVFAVRHWRYEQKLAGLLWRVDRKDVRLVYDPSATSLDREEDEHAQQRRLVRI